MNPGVLYPIQIRERNHHASTREEQYPENTRQLGEGVAQTCSPLVAEFVQPSQGLLKERGFVERVRLVRVVGIPDSLERFLGFLGVLVPVLQHYPPLLTFDGF